MNSSSWRLHTPCLMVGSGQISLIRSKTIARRLFQFSESLSNDVGLWDHAWSHVPIALCGRECLIRHSLSVHGGDGRDLYAYYSEAGAGPGQKLDPLVSIGS